MVPAVLKDTDTASEVSLGGTSSCRHPSIEQHLPWPIIIDWVTSLDIVPSYYPVAANDLPLQANHMAGTLCAWWPLGYSVFWVH